MNTHNSTNHNYIRNSINLNIKFLQLNLNRSGTAHDLLIQKINENNIDVCLGQEQNLKRSKNNFINDLNGDCFIGIYNKNIIIRNTYVGTGFCAVELENGIIFCSCYFSPNGNMIDFEILLENIRKEIIINHKTLIIGGDLNAKAISCGSSSVNNRGTIMEEWLATNDLISANNNTPVIFK